MAGEEETLQKKVLWKNKANENLKPAGEGADSAEANNCFWKNWGHLWICPYQYKQFPVTSGFVSSWVSLPYKQFPIKKLRKLRTVNWWSVSLSEIMNLVCSDLCKNGITKENMHSKCSKESPFHIISGSKAMHFTVSNVPKQCTVIIKVPNDWTNLWTRRVSKQCTVIFKVPNDWTNLWNKEMKKKSGSRCRIPGKESVQKEWSCLQNGGRFRCFRGHCQSVLEDGLPD